MTQYPKVSIVLPLYNVEAYLPQCLESLVNQTLTEIEIICVDDASTDDTARILGEYGATDSRIKVISHDQNKGRGPACNTGIAHCSGEYVGIVDGDDWVAQNMFELLYTTAVRDDVEICFCCVQRIDGVTDKALRKRCKYDALIEKRFDGTWFSWQDIRSVLFDLSRYSWNKIQRKSFLDAYGIRLSEIRYFQDNLFFYDAVLKAKRMSLVRKPLYNYRFNRLGASTTLSDKPFYLFDVNAEVKEKVLKQTGDSDLMARFDRKCFARYMYYWSQIPRGMRESYYKRVRDEVSLSNLANSHFAARERLVLLLFHILNYRRYWKIKSRVTRGKRPS